MLENVAIRDALSTDLDFIYNSWLKNYQATSYFAKRIPKQVFMEEHAKRIKKCLETAQVKIASPDEFLIYGYLIASNDCIHYVYVRPEFSRFGIAKMLVQSLNLKQIEASHWTPPMNEISKKHKIIYNPYRFFE